MSTTSCYPVFPLELFELILRNFDNSRYPNTRHCLEECSLVCKSFAEICQSRLFEDISSIGISDLDGDRSKLLRVIDVLEGKPRLLKSVRNLWFTFEFGDYDSSGVLSASEWERCQKAILSFPNLASLSIRYHVVEPFPFEHLADAAPNLIRTYASQTTLRNLDLESLNIPYQCVLASQHLQSLRVAFVDPPLLIYPGIQSSITDLTIEEFGVFPLSLLTHFPYLEQLDLGGIEEFKLQPMGDGPLSFKLQKLKIRFYSSSSALPMPPMLTTFVNFYKTRATIASTGPFDVLQHLVIDHLSREDTPSVQLMLECTPKLQTLCLEESIYYRDRFNGDDLLLLSDVLCRTVSNNMPLPGPLTLSKEGPRYTLCTHLCPKTAHEECRYV